MAKHKTRVRHYTKRNGVHVGSHFRGVKITDPRSKRARQQDLRTRAKHVLRPTKKNIQYWKKHRNQVDLIGVDVLARRVRRIRAAYKKKKIRAIGRRRLKQFKGRFRTLRARTGLTGIEEHALISIVERAVGRGNADKVDINAYIDPSLSYHENKQILKMAVSPTFRDAAYLGYV